MAKIYHVIITMLKGIMISKFFLRNNKKLFFMDLTLGFLRESVNIISVIFPALLIDIIISKKDFDVILLIIFITACVIALIGFIIEILQLHLSNYSLKAVNSLYYELNAKNTQIDLSDFENSDTEDAYYRAFDNIYNLSDVDYYLFCELISKVFTLLTMSYIFATINALALFVVIASIIVSFIIETYITKASYGNDAIISTFSARLRYLQESMYDFKIGRELRVFGATSLLVKRFVLESDNVNSLNVKMRKKEFKLRSLTNLIDVLQMCTVYLIAIAQQIKGVIHISSFIMYINAAIQLSTAIKSIFNCFGFFYKAGTYGNDYESYLKIPETMRTTGNNLVPSEYTNRIPLIEFVNVSFKYPNKLNYVLHNINLKIFRNEVISLVGDNGAGKTTLVKLILRLYDPTEGKILYNGVDIKTLEYEKYIALFAPVFQDYVIHAYTLRENIVFNKNITNELVFDTLNKTGLLKKVEQVGLDSNYTKRFYPDGIEFSGGEEQKLAISRALAKNTKFLILDEPTAAIDPLAENELYQKIFNIANDDITMLFISHRMSSTRFANRIYVLDKSKIVETGTHSELVRNNMIYADMFKKQSQYYHNEDKI